MKLLIVTILTFVSFASFAKEVWKSGQVIRAVGDTLKGEILFEDWKKNPTEVTLRANGSSKIYRVNAVLGFIIDQPKEIYLVRTAEVKYYLKVTVAQGADPTEKEETTTAFFELLYQLDDVMLFRLYDGEYTARFFLERGGKLLELRNVSFYTSKENTVNHIERPMYREELKQILADCNTLETTNLKYQEKAIVRVMNEYQLCTGKTTTSFEKLRLSPQINLGVTVGKPLVTGESFLTYSAALEIVSPRRFGKFSMLLEFGRMNDLNKTNYFGNGKQHFPYYALLGSAKLTNTEVAPVINFGFTSTSAFTLGAGLAHKSGTSLVIHRGLINSPMLADPDTGEGVKFFTVQFRVMVRISKSKV